MRKNENMRYSDKLFAKKISELIEGEDIRIDAFELLDSTNTEAKRQALGGLSVPALIIADGQSAGRGRMGRSFYSPASQGLYMSLLVNAKESVSDTLRLTTAASVAVARSIEEICGISVGIKWVNDLYLNGRKICGILCESFSGEDGKRYTVIGVGLNLYTEEFPQDIKNTAAALMPERGMREVFAARIAKKLLEYWKEPNDSSIIEYYRANSIVLGKEVVFIESGVEYRASVKDIDGLGRLCVCLSDGTQKILSSGEISLRVDK